MKLEKYNAVKKAIEQGRWTIDLINGKVYSSKGEVKNPNAKGYYGTTLSIDGKVFKVFVHEIIAIAVGLYPVDLTVDHIDSNNQNNRPENLQVISNRDNVRKQPRVITDEQRDYILKELGKGITQTELAKYLGITQACISQIKRESEGLKGTQKRLTEQEKVEIAARLKEGETVSSLSREYGVSRAAIARYRK